MIPPLVAKGLRAIAPDFLGFGRSDKPTKRSDYSVRNHIAWLGELIDQLDLRHVTLVVQDWGGPIGLGALVNCTGSIRPDCGCQHDHAHGSGFFERAAGLVLPRR